MKKSKTLKFTCHLAVMLMSLTASSQIVLNTPGVESKLYTGDSSYNKPLIVGLGGSEGGNAWASRYWEKTRNEFLQKGYAFLALGYFHAKGTPVSLGRISIDQVHAAISLAASNPQVNPHKIAIIGGSRGGDLALLIASLYKDIRCVVAIVPSNVAFPANTNDLNTSAWSYRNKELPFVPVSEAAVPFLLKQDLRSAFEVMLKDSIAVKKAVIQVEKIKGPILFMSADKDEVCPSSPMCDMMMTRLREKKFRFPYEHIVIEGSHSAPLQHFDKVFAFLDRNFTIK